MGTPPTRRPSLGSTINSLQRMLLPGRPCGAMASYLKNSVLLMALCGATVQAQPNGAGTPEAANAPSKFRSAEDGCLDVSGFLEQKYGFLPIVIPITEPAVGYGVGGGLMFLSRPLPQAEDGLGRPNITIVGGFGTENGTRGGFVGDLRYWLDDHLQTVFGFIDASVNLDFYG